MSHLRPEDSRYIQAPCLRCGREDDHLIEMLPDGRMRMTCVLCRFEGFVSAEDQQKPLEVWISELRNAHALARGGNFRRRDDVPAHKKRRQL